MKPSLSQAIVRVPSGSHDYAVTVPDGTAATYVSVLTDGGGPYRYEAKVGAGASLQWYLLSIGNVACELVSEVKGAGGRSSIAWGMIAENGARQTAAVRNVFSARDGGGEVMMRGVAESGGKIDCRGRIEIGPGGGGTQTYLTQNMLMLDASAMIDAVPGLEIKTNDVKASHSATVSRVNPEDLFYAATRGLPAEVARRLMIEGFLGELFQDIADETLRQELLDLVTSETRGA